MIAHRFVLCLCLSAPYVAEGVWVVGQVGDNCNEACARSSSDPCFSPPMNEIDSPRDVFLIDDSISQLSCGAVENVVFTEQVSSFPTLPRVERRDTGASLCQYASSGLSASCDARAGASNLRRICCCGTSPSSCPVAADVAEPDDDGDDVDPEQEDDGDKSSIWKGVLAAFGGIAAAVLLAGGVCGAFGLGFLVGEANGN